MSPEKMSPEEAYAEVLKRIRHARETNAEVLDLGDLPMSELPEELGKLHNLSKLDLHNCYKLTSVEPLRGLTNLTNLNLSWCMQLTSFEPLRRLTNLTRLDLSMLGQLTSVEPLRGLTKLTELNLANCAQLTTVEPLRGLINLTKLDLSWHDKLTSVEPLQGLINLTDLNLTWCEQLTSVEPLQSLTYLTNLYLSGGKQLTSLEPLGKLYNLRKLILFQCQKISIGDLRPLFPTLEKLFLQEAQCYDFPAELCGGFGENVLPAVRAYFTDLGQEPVADAEVKVYVLGNGRVGKTKLTRRVRGLDYGDAHENTTHGVRLYDQPVTIEDVPYPVRLNLWDFGGQDIYHASHSLFLRGPAVFLLLWCPEHENEKCFSENNIPLRNRRLPYWFDYLREHAGNKDEAVRSPVVLIQSQCDDVKQERQPDCELPNREEFPKLQVLHVSAKTEYNLADVKGDIGKAVRYLFQHFPRPKLGPGWVKVRDKIRKQQADGFKTLSRKDFDALCTEGVSNTGVLLKFLHESGVVFYQENLFSGQIILDQQWALDAIYTVCDRQRTLPHLMGDGKFTRDHLKLLAWDKFSDDEQRLFLDMMVSCGICFSTRQLNPGQEPAEYEYIAPDWLPGFSARATLHSREKSPSDAEATARFHFLHEGIVRSLLAKVGKQFGDNAIYWKYGFWFRSEASELLAQVNWDAPESSSLAGKISLKAWGPNSDKLITAVLETLSRVTTGSKPEIEQPGAKLKEVAEPHFVDVRGVEALPVARSTTVKDDRRVFISYAWGDQSEDGQRREKLVDGMWHKLKEWGHDPFQDKKQMSYGDLITDAIKQAGVMPRVVGVLSAKYFKSVHCMSEMGECYLNCGLRDDLFLLRFNPVSLEDAKFYTDDEREQLETYWHDELTKLLEKLRTRRAMSVTPSRLDRMCVWVPHVARMLEVIWAKVHPVGFEPIANNGFAAIKEMLRKPR
jgi:internalin A